MTGILAMTNFLFSQIFFCIVLILIGYSQVPVLSVFVDPAIRHAVRYTDDGLFATTLIAYEKEWNETFIAGVCLHSTLQLFAVITLPLD